MNLDLWEEKVRRFETLELREMQMLLRSATDLLIEESNVQNIHLPVTICGDIHGQFPDLLRLFELAGEIKSEVSSMHYVFLGDLVDRGFNSVEVLSYLLILKLKFPHKISLIRGNHETRQVTTMYGFYDECNKKYTTIEVWKLCTEVFDCMPIAALIDGKALCIHGGLSPEVRAVDQIRLLNRRQEIPNEGPFSDLVWSDPDSVDGWEISQRGAGYLFGAKVTREFLFRNNLNLIARAHQLVHEGFKYHFDEEFLCTVWSAPNYCYRCNNLASVLRIYEDESREFLVFKEVQRQFLDFDSPRHRPSRSFTTCILPSSISIFVKKN
ncbi:protein serine/threonine phosphatase, e [Angomonas deanei]|nr:protein serine/threonine phosphatase, e [Angomonas deanei]|eukprot:EPY26891.1 protein serine/threonine phosphatase, e [Angomonas deanei]